MRRAGLDEDLSSARIYLGEMPANLTRPPGGVPEPSEPDRIRLFGRPSPLIGVMPGIEATSSKVSLTLEDRPWDAVGNGTALPIDRHDSSPCGSLTGHGAHRPLELARVRSRS